MAPLTLVKKDPGPSAMPVHAYQRPAVRAINGYSAALGDGDEGKGRERLLTALMLTPSDDERVDHLLQLAEDPEFRGRSIGELAVAAGWRAGALLKILRDSVLLLAQVGGLRIVADGLPDVVADVVNRAQRHFTECEGCNGTGQVRAPKTKDNPAPTEMIPCGTCMGEGKLVREADTERQQMVLEMAKLLAKGGGAQIAIQQNVGGGEGGKGGGASPLGNLFDRMIAATDQVMGRSAVLAEAEEAPLEAEVVDTESDAGSTDPVQDPLDAENPAVVPSAADVEPLE